MRTLDDLTLYVAGFLDAAAEREIEAHAKACPECRAMIDRIDAEHRFLRDALRVKSASTVDVRKD